MLAIKSRNRALGAYRGGEILPMCPRTKIALLGKKKKKTRIVWERWVLGFTESFVAGVP